MARQAVAALESDFDPASDELEASLELALRRIRGHIIPPGSWNWDAVPSHLRVSFKVVDSTGKVLDEGKDLAALQERLAPATRRAIAESLGATSGTTDRSPAARPPAGHPLGTEARERQRRTPGFREQSGLTAWTFGTVQRQVSNTVKGHTVTGYPALVDEGEPGGASAFSRPFGTAGGHEGRRDPAPWPCGFLHRTATCWSTSTTPKI